MDPTPPQPEPLPPSLDYQSPLSAARHGSRGRFILGIVAGVAASSVAYLGFWNATFNAGTGIPFFVVVGLKILAFLVLLFVKGWRSFGVGVLVSMPVVVLIFFGICTVMLVVP